MDDTARLNELTQDPDNVRRLLACWDALFGIATEAIEVAAAQPTEEGVRLQA